MRNEAQMEAIKERSEGDRHRMIDVTCCNVT